MGRAGNVDITAGVGEIVSALLGGAKVEKAAVAVPLTVTIDLPAATAQQSWQNPFDSRRAGHRDRRGGDGSGRRHHRRGSGGLRRDRGRQLLDAASLAAAGVSNAHGTNGGDKRLLAKKGGATTTSRSRRRPPRPRARSSSSCCCSTRSRCSSATTPTVSSASPTGRTGPSRSGRPGRHGTSPRGSDSAWSRATRGRMIDVQAEQPDPDEGDGAGEAAEGQEGPGGPGRGRRRAGQRQRRGPGGPGAGMPEPRGQPGVPPEEGATVQAVPVVPLVQAERRAAGWRMRSASSRRPIPPAGLPLKIEQVDESAEYVVPNNGRVLLVLKNGTGKLSATVATTVTWGGSRWRTGCSRSRPTRCCWWARWTPPSTTTATATPGCGSRSPPGSGSPPSS